MYTSLQKIWILMITAAAQLITPLITLADQGTEQHLAKQLQNPIAALISLPLQLNYDENIGIDDEGERLTLNIQPVIPFDLSRDWNIISRTILPVVWQDDIISGAGSQTGIGDIVQSAFFSPKAPTAGGWIWGAGPVFLLPSGSDDLLTVDKWGAGPTAVAVKQQGPWTIGCLTNHIWSFAGDDDRADVSSTFLQGFTSYTTPTAWSYSLNIESTYDWENEQWSVPVNLIASKVVNIGGQMMSFNTGIRYWAKSPDSGPEGWGFRFVAVFMFPK